MRPLLRTLVGIISAVSLTVIGVAAAPSAAAACEPAPGAQACVAYGNHSRQVMDVFFQSPTSPEPRPAVLFIHGGAWSTGDKADVAGGALDITQYGWVGLSMNYRLAGNGTNAPYLDQPADVEAAVEFIRTHAAVLNIDPDRIALVGGSAGAHLAMLHATRTTTQPVRTVVSFVGPTNLTAAALLPLSMLQVGGYVGECLVLLCPQRYANGSPVNHVSPDTPPMFLVYGLLDLLVPITQGQQMASRLQANGVPHQFVTCVCDHSGWGGHWPAAKAFLQQQLE